MANQVIRPLFGDGRVETLSKVFDELLLTVEALDGIAGSLTDEESHMDACQLGTNLALATNYIRQLANLGFHLAVQAKQPARTTTKNGR